jgi:acetyltransferase-like isoleucine patch superfamily enzyme
MIAGDRGDSGGGRIIASNPSYVHIKKEEGARLVLNGNLILRPAFGIDDMFRTNPAVVSIGRGGTLIIDSDFVIGDGVRLFVGAGALLYIGGKMHLPSDSGITENTTVLANKRIVIGYDCIFAWNISIIDSDWHEIDGDVGAESIQIYDRVWVGMNVSIMKGSHIREGCVISAHSRVDMSTHTEAGHVYGGIPARKLKGPVTWK